MMNLRADMDRFYKSFFGGSPDEQEGFWAPVVDIIEDKENYIVKAEIPGMKKEDIKVTVRDNIIAISGERSSETEEKDKTYHRIERSYGRFSRTIALPSAVDAAKIKASYKDGVLQVTLPKPESAKPRQVDVEIK
jgi:HSP20 family protein